MSSVPEMHDVQPRRDWPGSHGLQAWVPGKWSKLEWVAEQTRVHPCTTSRKIFRRRAPRLLLFQHVPKTGGTSVRNVLRKMAGSKLDLFVPHGAARCFMYHAYGSLIGRGNESGCDGWRAGQCENATFECCAVPNWRVSTIVVEFHVSPFHDSSTTRTLSMAYSQRILWMS